MGDHFEKTIPKSSESLNSDISNKPISINRVLFFALLMAFSSGDISLADSPSEDAVQVNSAEAICHPLLESLDYRNIDKLDLSKVDTYLIGLKEAIENGLITMRQVREKIIPPMAYASGLYFSDNFLDNVLPKRIKERSDKSDAYTQGLRRFVSEGRIARQNRASHEKVFAAYVRVFGESVDLDKTSNIFEVWGPDNIPFERDHPDAIDIYYLLIKKVGIEHFGPPVLAYQSGVVIAAEGGWEGGTTKESYLGGGLGGKTGNGVIIFNPKKRQYTFYMHFRKVAVQSGDIVEAGQVIGEGGNTGIDARNPRYRGRHVHFEIHRYNKEGQFEYVPKEELHERLSGEKP